MCLDSFWQFSRTKWSRKQVCWTVGLSADVQMFQHVRFARSQYSFSANWLHKSPGIVINFTSKPGRKQMWTPLDCCRVKVVETEILWQHIVYTSTRNNCCNCIKNNNYVTEQRNMKLEKETFDSFP